ncbi:MAG: hypothetical protein ACLFM1_03720 [Bacteroidales bacterium]
MKQKSISLTSIFVLVVLSAGAQWLNPPDEAKYIEKEDGFYEQVILQDSGEADKTLPQVLTCEFDDEYPTNIIDYESVWHLMPISQGNAGTCWSFAATSFFESEIFRLNNEEIDLSEMFFVYWDYVDRAEHFVKTRGETYIAQGSEANALKRIMPVYGCMPESAYPGKTESGEYHTHADMFQALDNYLSSVAEKNQWNVSEVRDDVRAILDSYMGEMPEEFLYKGESYTPMSFYEAMPFKAGDMVSFMSTMSVPYNEKNELVEPDNWWHSEEYYNVSVEDFYGLCETAIQQDYSVCICGDVSEPGHDSRKEVGIIPEFDIPSQYINKSSRELRLVNKATTDDHCIHIVGYHQVGDDFWFLIKDSGAGGFDGKNKGYRFYHEDYIRLKMMNIMLHKDAAREVLDKIIKK